MPIEGLKGRIPGLLAIEVGIDFPRTDDSGDIVRYSAFESRQALDDYQSHPRHKEIMPFIMAARMERRMVDDEGQDQGGGQKAAQADGLSSREYPG